MLTRFVRTQLTIFTIASIIGVLVMVFVYMQVPTLLGIGKITVTLELPSSGGLYRFSNVTYRGVQVGKVTDLTVTKTGAKATLSLDTSPKIPVDLQADVRSVSALGEQYVDLRPRAGSGPYLKDGSVIPAAATTIPQEVGPMVDQVSALIGSIPKEKLSDLLDESYKAFNGIGDDLGSLFDSSAKFSGDLNANADRARGLIDDSGPFLDGQVDSADAIRTWAHSLANVTQTIANNDQSVRSTFDIGPGAADEASKLLDQIKPTLPVLLANLTSIGQLLVVYHASLEQVLVLLPPSVATERSGRPLHDPGGSAMGNFEISVADPPVCTVGFLPPSQWRSPNDTTTIDTPDDLYCKLPQDSPIGVRGVRNFPCIRHPGKRAPTVKICDSDQPYEPLAMRQHFLGPMPFDPNAVAQGIPLDDRVDSSDRMYAPVEGTPLPPGAAPSGTPPNAPPPDAPPPGPTAAPAAPPPPGNSLDGDPLPPAEVPPPAPDGSTPAAAPSAFTADGGGATPSVALAHYNPQTGMYVTPGGHVYRQTNLSAAGAPKSWEDMMPI